MESSIKSLNLSQQDAVVLAVFRCIGLLLKCTCEFLPNDEEDGVAE